MIRACYKRTLFLLPCFLDSRTLLRAVPWISLFQCNMQCFALHCGSLESIVSPWPTYWTVIKKSSPPRTLVEASMDTYWSSRQSYHLVSKSSCDRQLCYHKLCLLCGRGLKGTNEEHQKKTKPEKNLLELTTKNSPWELSNWHLCTNLKQQKHACKVSPLFVFLAGVKILMVRFKRIRSLQLVLYMSWYLLYLWWCFVLLLVFALQIFSIIMKVRDRVMKTNGICNCF